LEQTAISFYTFFLEQVLTPKRLQHSFGVMQVMGELAKVYALDPEKAIITGLLHDAAKDLPLVHQQQLIKEFGIKIEIPCEQDYNLYLHGPVSAYYVYKELGITDKQILDAIRMHCYTGNGENFNSVFTWCLRFSDILEPNRVFGDVRWFREGKTRLNDAVYSGRLAEAAFLQTGWLLKMYEEKGFPIHPNLKYTHDDFSRQLNVDDAFLDNENYDNFITHSSPK
jgi:predicted HD superfamily hydrolase involved in NAD metabolism